MSGFSMNKSSGINYRLDIPMLPVMDDIKDSDILTLNIFETITPAISLSTNDVRWMGAKIPIQGAEIDFDDLTVQFVVDNKWDNWFYLYKWITFVNNNKDKFVEDFRNYCVDVTMFITDNYGDDVLRIDFTNVIITSLNDTSMSSKDGEENLICGAVLKYQRYECTKIN